MKFSKIGQLFFLYSLYFIGALSAYIIFYVHIDGKGDLIHSTQEEIFILRQQNDELKNITHMVRGIEDSYEKLEKYFVGEDIIYFIEVLEQMRDDASVKLIKTISEPNIKENEPISELEFSLRVEKAPLEDVYHFLTLLETVPYKITIDTARFTKTVTVTEEEEEIELWDMTARVRTLQLRNSKE